MYRGRCECGAVAFEIAGPLTPPSICHCSQCRRLSGHAWSGTWARVAELKFNRDDGLKWYRSSAWAERGFCAECGASLFYRLTDDAARISVAPGSLDQPTGLRAHRHIYVGSKGDYYDIADGLAQLEEH